MVKINIEYQGQLHCQLTHVPSGAQIVTDAPKDNNGKGEAFSPTDLVAGALGSCMMTVMGIVAFRHNISLEGTRMEVTKEMIADPIRRIKQISVSFIMAKGIAIEKRNMLEHAALTCPVHKSLHPDVTLPINFIYPD